MENTDNQIEFNINIGKQYYYMVNFIVTIFGLVIGLIFGYLIFNKNTYVGPDSNQIVNKIYTDSNGKKYKYIPKICVCPINLSMDKLKNKEYKDPNH